MPKDWNEQEARTLRSKGMTFRDLGQMFGISGTKVRCLLDPEYAEHRAKQYRASSRRQKAMKAAAAQTAREQRREQQRAREREERKSIGHVAAGLATADRAADEGWVLWRANLANLPRDDRTLTGIVLGDPPSWRSALAAKQENRA